ncbi:MAG: NlpC/P60 family protein [Coriobacteriia bacterium]|nr:NlpC/P60 family protein [Coriobacteriia bacterium]
MLISTVPASAVPASKMDQARAVKSQVDNLDLRVEVAAERYNEASSRHGSLVAQKRTATKRLAKVKKRMGVVQRHLNQRANSMYRQGQLGFVTVLFGTESFEEFASTWDILKDLNTSDAESISELKGLRVKAKKARDQVAAKERAAAKQVAVMKANKRSIESQLAERKAKLRGLEAEIAALRAAEEAARRVQASSFVSQPDRSFPPPTRAPRSEVVAIAKRYLGAPYVWAANGPNSFDCSGLTSFVYRQVGVSLPRTSRAQIHAGERVSRSDLQPGDLVFFGSPIRHVGMYVGGGMYIHAPRTGDVVKISSMARGDYAGACRP